MTLFSRGRRSLLLSGLTVVLTITILAQPAYAVEYPSWWNGYCDTNNNPSHALETSYNGIVACAPSSGGTNKYVVQFFQNSWGEYEWQCVELVMRYMYLVHGIAPYEGHGYQVVNNYTGSKLVKIPNNGAGLPTPGDILSYKISTSHPIYGHTSVVIGVGVDGTGNGSVVVMEQNASPTGSSIVTVRNRIVGDGVTGWLHDPKASSSVANDVQMIGDAVNAVYAKNTVSSNGWTQEASSGNAAKIAAGGNTQMFLRGDGMVFAKTSIGDGGWVQETSANSATAIAVSSTGLQMIIGTDAAIYAKPSVGWGGWTQEVGPGNASKIAVGGNTMMFLRGDGAMLAKNDRGGTWVQETSPGSTSDIAVSSTGVHMIIGTDAAIYAKNGIGWGGWTQEVGPGNASKIAVGGNTQMFIRGDAAVFATDSIGRPWTQETAPGNASAIAVGSNGTQMFLRGDAAVFAKTTIGDGGWVQETDPATGTTIAVG